jgi:hypothetical protein
MTMATQHCSDAPLLAIEIAFLSGMVVHNGILLHIAQQVEPSLGSQGRSPIAVVSLAETDR